jgi:hypothetical protein
MATLVGVRQPLPRVPAARLPAPVVQVDLVARVQVMARAPVVGNVLVAAGQGVVVPASVETAMARTRPPLRARHAAPRR